MFPLPWQHTTARRGFAALYSTVLLLALATAARAQMGGIDRDPGDRGTGGLNTIQGQVYSPSGRLLETRVRVRLSSSTGADLHTLSDDSGSFSFRRLTGGTYFISVDVGKEYEPATETVNIIEPARARNQTGRTYTLQIQLQLKGAVAPKPAVLDASLAVVPQPALKLYEQAIDSSRTGDPKKAIKQLKEAVKLHPQFALALNELGVQHLRLLQYDEAAAALRTAIQLEPDAATPRLNYGILLVEKKEFAAADEELRRVLEKSNASAQAHLFRGRALIGLGNYQEAERELRRALKLGGAGVSEAYRYLGAAYIELGDPRQAADMLDEYLRATPKAKDGDRIREIIKQLRR